MKICAYVQEAYAKANYKVECMESRSFVGLRVVVDCLERAGYEVDYAGIATVHEYDIVLVSLTSDCDWWSFIDERTRWQSGRYKVLIGGAGLLHITPFLPFGDYFMFGRGEDLVVPLVRGIERDGGWEHESVACSETFSPERIYRLAQTDRPYPYPVRLSETRDFIEGPIGCNHKCFFCGYTWHRRFLSPDKYFHYNESGLFGSMADKERAMLRYEGKAHQIKFYNIVGYPTETDEDWMEFLDTLRTADERAPVRDKQWSIVLHSTPFRPMPATPMACEPMSYRNYRGELGRVLGKGLRGNLIYQGRSLWSVESMGTESLPTVILSAICHRATEQDTESIIRIARSRKFRAASSAVKQATLERYFDVETLFGRFTPETLPSRYLRSYARVEKLWGKPFGQAVPG